MIDNPEFAEHIPYIYPRELQLNKANTSDKETFFLDLNMKVIGSKIYTSVYDKRDDFGFPIVNFPWLSGDVPRLPSYGIYISQLVQFARCLLAFMISIRSLQNYWHRVTDTCSFGKRWRRRQYDLAIIDRTIGLVLGPYTALYRTFLKRCTLTIKAVGTIWRALSKPPKRRQGPDPHPLWLLVGTPSAFGPALAYRLRAAQPSLLNVPIYFWYTIILLSLFVYHIFITSPLWLAVVSLYKEGNLQFFLMCVVLITRLLRLVGRLSARKPV